jgi:GntR family transcriptional regulator
MLLRLPPDDAPLHERIASAVRGAIADRDVAIGDRLPATRDVAEQLDVNINTVLRAYRQLRDEGLVELRRGRGAIVRGRVDRAALTPLVDGLLEEAARTGMQLPELLALVEERAR